MKTQNILIGILVASIFFNFYGLLTNKNMNFEEKNNMTNGVNTHKMPDGKVMHNDMQMEMKNDMGNMMMNMTENMKGKTGIELEKVFLEDMIVHHQGAVDMANLLLQDKSIKSELKVFAENIISAQNPEIEQMKTWLKNY